jgi:two-component system cell cycle sensor histidine kinase/response regulator CckA
MPVRLNSQHALHAIVESTGVALVVADAAGTIALVNRQAERLFGYSRETLIGTYIGYLIVPPVPPSASDEGRDLEPMVGVRSDGVRIPVLVGVTVLDIDRLPYVLATVLARSEQGRSEAAVRASEERFRDLAAHVKEAFVIVDLPGGHVQYVSPAFEEIWHRSAAEVQADPNLWLAAIHPDDQEQVGEHRLENLRGRPTAGVFRVVRPDGSIRWARYRMFPVPEAPHPRRLVGVIEDISEQRVEEHQLHQAQKMEAIGQLAGGIAHDFNNLLTAILGYGELVFEQLDPSHPARADLTEMIKAAQSAAALTTRILAFSRRQILQPRVLDLNHVLERLEVLLRRVIGEDVTLDIRTEPSLLRTFADAGQIEQIILNLAVNARDAMPDGGRLTIRTANVVLDDDYVRRHAGCSPGPQVMLAVSDEGMGMDEATQKRVFEPFFTTKGPGKGTGLGLSTVYGIVKQSGGSIWIDSERGVGSTFKIYLPVATVAEDATMPSAPPLAPRGTETVLVVEDQDEVRAVIGEALRRAGYSVLESRDGEQALVLAGQHPGTIHLVIADVIMPQMDGRRVVRAIRSKRPDVRALYTSGYTDDVIVRHGILDAGLAFLQKPFTAAALARKIREVLEAAQPPPV